MMKQSGIRLLFCYLCILLLSGQSTASPSVWWVSDYTLADESALIVGEDLDQVLTVSLETATTPVELPLLKQQADQLVIRLPPNTAYGSHALRLYNRQQQAYTRIWLNAPKVDWLQGNTGVNKASSGGWLRLFGKNINTLALNSATLINPKGNSQPLSLKKSDAWHSEFSIPDHLSAGRYQLKFAVKTATLAPPEFTVEITAPLVDPITTLNIQDLGAGQHKTDDSAIFTAALEKLTLLGGGTLYIPTGNYRLSSTLYIPKNVRLMGDGSLNSNLVWSALATEQSALIVMEDNTTLKGLSLYYDDAAFGITSTMTRQTDNVLIDDIVMRISAYRGHLNAERLLETYNKIQKKFTNQLDSIRLRGSNITIRNSDIYGTGRSLYIYDSQGVNITQNKFYNGRRGWYSFSGCSEVIFEQNTITGSDLMASGGGINTLGDKPISRNIYFANNDLSMFNGWDREALTSDGVGSVYFGGVKSHRANRLTLDQNQRAEGMRLTKHEGAGFFVVHGKGMGQYARIISLENNTVTLDRTLKTTLDSSSKVILGPLQENYLIVNNRFSDAYVAVQFYGAALNHVVYGNTATRTAGIHVIGLWYHGYQPAWYTLIAHNTLEGASVQRLYNPARAELDKSVIMIEARPRSSDELNLILGIAVKNNILNNQNQVRLIGAANVKSNDMSAVLVDANQSTNPISLLNVSLDEILLKQP